MAFIFLLFSFRGRRRRTAKPNHACVCAIVLRRSVGVLLFVVVVVVTRSFCSRASDSNACKETKRLRACSMRIFLQSILSFSPCYLLRTLYSRVSLTHSIIHSSQSSPLWCFLKTEGASRRMLQLTNKTKKATKKRTCVE